MKKEKNKANHSASEKRAEKERRKLRIADFKWLKGSELKNVIVSNPQSAIRNPQFPSLLLSLSFILATLIFTPLTTCAQQRPLITEDVETVKPGSVRFDLGFDFLQDKDFTISGL